MKLAPILFLLTTVFGFADELSLQMPPRLEIHSLPTIAPAGEGKKKGSIYFRAMTESQSDQSANVFPGYGVGYRRSFSESGVDISLNFSGGAGDVNRVLWTAPKVSYLHYLNPKSDAAAYLGGGLAWGGMHRTNNRLDQDDHFVGLIPHVTLGCELTNHSQVFTFTELSVSQPLIPSSIQGQMPGPVAELSIGAGF